MAPGSFLNSPKYLAWKATVEKSGCRLRGVEALQELSKPDGSPLFGLLRAQAEDPQGRPLPAYVMIRGNACVVVTVVVNGDTGERKFLMLRQRRLAHGREALEFPAGMLDGDVGDPLGAAVRELKEETGISVSRSDLMPLCDRPLYSSPGLDDEAIHYFACTVELPADRFHALEGRKGGVPEENEFIRLGLWDYEEAIRKTDCLQVRLGFYLYREHMGEKA